MRDVPSAETAAPALVAARGLPTRIVRPVQVGIWGMGLAALIASVSAAVSIGAVAVPLGTVWGVILDKISPGLLTPDWSAGRASIVWDIRLPRALLAALVGAGLALVGAVLQSVTRNHLAELEQRRQGGIGQLRRAHASHRQRPRRWDDVRRDAATQIDPLDLPEFAIRQNGRELQGLIKGGRGAGGFEIVESESHVAP